MKDGQRTVPEHESNSLAAHKGEEMLERQKIEQEKCEQVLEQKQEKYEQEQEQMLKQEQDQYPERYREQHADQLPEERGNLALDAERIWPQTERGRFNRRAVSVEEAQHRVLTAAQPLHRTELVPLEQAWGRRLAKTLLATTDWPPFARSGLDGYALRAADARDATAANPAVLRVIDSVEAGGVSKSHVTTGTAVRIMTGAAVPEGADAVVMLEQTEDAWLAGQPVVRVKHAVLPGQHVAQPGDEFRRGSAVVLAGARLAPGHIGQLGTFGYAELPVYARPRVAVFATGSELLPVAQPLAPGRIRDSNSAMVAALAEQAGALVQLHGRLPDDATAIEQALRQAALSADCIVTTGGVSVGDFDAMAQVLRRLATEQTAVPTEQTAVPTEQTAVLTAALNSNAAAAVLFNKVAMRPGSPTSAAILEGKLLFALSGNPGACHTAFELFVRPCLLRLQGSTAPLPEIIEAELTADIKKGSPHVRYVRCLLHVAGGRVRAEPLAFGKSSMLASLPQAQGLLVVPSGAQGASAGSLLPVVWLPFFTNVN